MKRILIMSLMAALFTVGCNTNQNEMDEKEDTGIKPDRDYETAAGDTTKTDEINATGNAESGPDEGP